MAKSKPLPQKRAGILVNRLLVSTELVAPVRPGKQALKASDKASDKDCVLESGSAQVVDSIDLDSALQAKHPSENRWDYLLGVRLNGDHVVAAEVHPASPGEVDIVIRKREAAKSQLIARGVTAQISLWCWIASGKVNISKTTPQYRRLALSGIKLCGRLDLGQQLQAKSSG